MAVLGGDGIGTEVMPPALEVLEAVGRRRSFDFRWTEHDWGCDRYKKTGAMMPNDAIDQVRTEDAILLWAGAMMLEHLGRTEAAAEVVAAIEAVLASEDAPKTPDLGGKAKTADVAKALLTVLPGLGSEWNERNEETSR